MAHIKHGAYIVMTRGKVGGTVFSHNAGGDYAKNNQIPTNPQTTRQTLIRVRNTQNAQAWRGLTDSQRTAWNNATVNFPQTNIFGDTFFLSGEQLFIKFNNVLLNINSPTIVNPPTPAAVPNLTFISLTALAGSMSITFLPTPVGTGTNIVVYATPPLSAGITNFQRELRQITIIPIATGSPLSIFAPYIAKYGVAPSLGTRIGLKTQPALVASGIQGAELFTSTIQL